MTAEVTLVRQPERPSAWPRHPWHADQSYYWPLSSDRCVTVWVPLQETPAEMGPLAFAAGSHRFAIGRDLPISDESEQRLQQALTEQGFSADGCPVRRLARFLSTSQPHPMAR